MVECVGENYKCFSCSNWQVAIRQLYQSKELLTDDIAVIFADASSDEAYVMLQAANAIKQSMRVRKLSKESG